MYKILSFFLAVSLFGLTGCAETQFGAHVVKNIDRSASSAGKYKVGNPYIIDGQEYYPQENFDYAETGMRVMVWPRF